MKKITVVLLSLLVAAVLISACSFKNTVSPQTNDDINYVEYTSSTNGDLENNKQNGQTDSYSNHLLITADNDLTAEEINDLLYMREEEKLARDVYQFLYKQWGLTVFQSISQSEQNHMDSILELLVAYGINDPAENTAVGEFTNEELQNLYNTLIDQGKVSLEQALRVGALIEEVDIQDLEDALLRTTNTDITRVYSNLMFGSENHLRSFINQLLRQVGVVYEPSVLSIERYQEIIDSQFGRGGGRLNH